MARLAVGSRTRPDNPLVKFACPYCKHSSFETISSVNKHIAGFHKAPTPRGVVYKTPAGVNTANKLIINLSTSRSPTLYLWLSPAPVSVSTAESCKSRNTKENTKKESE